MTSDADDMLSGGARDPGLCRNPHKAFAGQQLDPIQRVQHWLRLGGVVGRAMNPDGLVIRARVEQLFLGRIGDGHERDGANALCQAFDPAADGRQGGLVADKKPSIERVRDHQRAAGAADLDGVSDPSLLRPADRRPRRMQCNVDGQLFCFGIEVSRGEVAGFEIAPFARDIEFDVIVGGWGGEVLEVVAGKDYPQHPRRDMPRCEDGERPAAGIVPDAPGSVFHIWACSKFHFSRSGLVGLCP